MFRGIGFLGLTIALLGLASAQVEIVPVRINTPPILDGCLDDEVWQQAIEYNGFETFQPDFNKPPSERTIVEVAYDDQYIYFAVEALDSEPDKIKAAVTKWDNLYQDDWVGVGIDALNDQQSAYAFVANAYGSQGDLMLDPQGNGDPAEDFIWDAAGALNDSGFCVEMRIPLQSIRYSTGREVEMGIFFIRQLSRYSEMIIFPPVYPDKGSLLTQSGKVVFQDLRYHRTYEVLPSFTQTANKAAEAGALKIVDEESGSDVGLTAKVGLTPTLTMDLTVNPDFSQIESDASQVDVNLRYDIDYPEKRPFFLEGIKNFDVAGTGQTSGISRVVRTRTIADPSLGLKLSGKLGQRNAIAALFARDEAPYFPDEIPFNTERADTADVAIIRYKRLLKDESYVGCIYALRQYLEAGKGYINGNNRVVGLDGLWRLSGTMAIEGNAFYGLTKDPDSSNARSAHNFDLSWQYGDRKWFFEAGVHDISENFQLHTGYIPRDGTTTFNLSGKRTFYFESHLLQKVNVGYWGYTQRDRYYDMNDGCHNVYLQFGMPRTTLLELEYAQGTEVYEGVLFDRGRREVELSSQIFRSLYFLLEVGTQESPWYEESDNPFQGDIAFQVAFLNFQPTESFSSEFVTVRQVFTSRKDNLELYDYQIYRNKTTYQLNKYLFIRGILDYTYVKYRDYHIKFPEAGEVPDEKGLTAEFLAGFTYIPGTVIYLGYGSRLENLAYDEVEMDYLPSSQITEMKRGLFFKASYNWRI
ncbi:MAG: DUF5916 domain-containing protein [Candidatus Neomarinimicrobiota bacterium]